MHQPDHVAYSQINAPTKACLNRSGTLSFRKLCTP